MTTDSSASTSPPHRQAINRFGRTVWEHWERHQPSRLDEITDPTTYFADLGRLIETEIDTECRSRASTPDRATTDRSLIEEEVLSSFLSNPTAAADPTNSPNDPDLIDAIELSPDSTMIDVWRNSPLLRPGG